MQREQQLKIVSFSDHLSLMIPREEFEVLNVKSTFERIIEASLNIREYPDVLTQAKILVWKNQKKKLWYNLCLERCKPYLPLHKQCTLCFDKFDKKKTKQGMWNKFMNSLLCAPKQMEAPHERSRFWCFFCQEHHCQNCMDQEFSRSLIDSLAVDDFHENVLPEEQNDGVPEDPNFEFKQEMAKEEEKTDPKETTLNESMFS